MLPISMGPLQLGHDPAQSKEQPFLGLLGDACMGRCLGYHCEVLRVNPTSKYVTLHMMPGFHLPYACLLSGRAYNRYGGSSFTTVVGHTGLSMACPGMVCSAVRRRVSLKMSLAGDQAILAALVA